MEQLDTSSTMITHSTALKTDLGGTAAIVASMESPKSDVLVPVNGNELSDQNGELSPSKSLENEQHISKSDACIINGTDLNVNYEENMTKDSVTELDESSKGGKMNMESLTKDDAMDVNIEDCLNMDNIEDLTSINSKEETEVNSLVNNEDHISKKIVADEESKKTESEINDKALNSSELNKSAILSNLESDNMVKESREVNEESSEILNDPLSMSENDITTAKEKNLMDSQESSTEINSLFSELEKNYPSQDTYVSDSLLNLSENLINLNSEEINLNCSEKADSVNNGDVPEANSDKLTVLDEILNKELDDGERLIDNLINGSSVEGKESGEVGHSFENTELLLDSIKNPESLTWENETGGPSKDNQTKESVIEKELLQTQEEDKSIVTEEINEEELLKDASEKPAEVMDVEAAPDNSMDVDLDENLNNDVEMPECDASKQNNFSSNEQSENLAVTDEMREDDASKQNNFSSNEQGENLAVTDEMREDDASKQNTFSSNEQGENLAVTDEMREDDASKLNNSISYEQSDNLAVTDNKVTEESGESKTVCESNKEMEAADISELVSELDVLFNDSPKNDSHHDTSSDTIVDEDLSKEKDSDLHNTSIDTIVDENLPKEKDVPSHHDTVVDEGLSKENTGTEDVPFGILEATSIPPTEFENMESAVPNEIPNLSELAQNALDGGKAPKTKIQVRTIKMEKSDFNIKEEIIEESYDQMTFQEDIKPNLELPSVISSNKNNKKHKKKQSPFLTTSCKRKRSKLKKMREAEAGTPKPDVSQKKKKPKKVTPAKPPTVKKSSFPVISLANDTKAPKRSRSSLNSTVPASSSNPNAKKPRLSLPNVKNTRTGGKRLLRSAGEITEKIQDLVNKDERTPPKINNKVVKGKTNQVARKSTTHVKLPVARKSTTQVARKRGKPFFRAREPEPIFVDTNFGGQDMDMFINENDDEDSVTYYDPRKRYDYPRSPRKRLRPCEVVIQRMPIIDKLLPVKKEEKLEPNICESCDPKRIFLSKSSLAEHIKLEHLKNSVDTMVIPITESPKKEADEIKACSYCKKPFHSKNRLTEHMKTCKSEMSKKVLKSIPGIDLWTLNSDTKEIPLTKSVTISYAKKNEDKAAPTTNHVCKICNRKFLMATGLKSHMKTHKAGTSTPKPQKPGKSNLTCDICDKNFQFCSDLVEHTSFHSLPSDKEKDILITNLNKISNVEINVESYVESSESDDNLSDESSDYSYTMKNEPLAKINFSPNKCHECGRVFTIKTVYDRHVGLISKISNLRHPYTCPICDIEMKYRCRLGAHIETHKPQPEEQLICKKCNKTFRCENNLIRHELEHEGKLKVSCQYCSLSFNSMSDLYSHQGDCKFKSNEYKCNLCKRVFTAKWRLDLHMKTDEKHGTDPQQPNTYFCDQCGREFKHLSVLKRHVDSRCGTEPLYECPDCDKKYFSQGSLASHKRAQHSTEKNFMCQYCSKDFFTKHQLHRHEMRHNPDVRPYRCKYPNCDKTYRQPDSLRAHECEHTGVYPYACEFCGLQFSNVKSLKLHRKSANHWSDVEPNKVVTQACRRRHLSGRKEHGGKEPSEEEEVDPEGREDEPKNLVVNEAQFDGIYGGERVAVPQYSTLQPFTVNHLMHHNQQNPVLVQAPHPLTSYTQAIENYFVIASQQEPMAAAHHHSMMN